MSNYNNLKTAIDANIKQNGNQEITGPILNSVLNQMVNILGTGYQFAGVATLNPATEPGTPDAKVFYIANGKGTYTNFGGIEVTEDDVVVLYWDTAWHKVATGIASQAKLSELKEKVDALALGAFYGYFPDSASLPTDMTTPGYAYVGLDNPYKIWNFNGESWSDSGTSIDMNDADEEDITRNTDGKLQFKDRPYGDGMGYVILRKDKTFAEQVTIPNTIYEIRYQFDLGGASVTIPAGCVLKFIGGQLSNGKLISQATKFENMSGALNSIVLSEALENFNEIILDENYSCTFKGFHKISLGTDISIIGRQDFILWKDEKLFDFHLNGNGHKITIDSSVRFISDKLVFSNVHIISSVVGVSFNFYATLLDARGGADIHCVNCSFTNLYISGTYHTLNYNNCIFSNCRQIYGWNNLPDVGGCERNFTGCKFIAGTLNQTENYAFVQVSFNGWDGKTLFDGCSFADNIGMNADWIDTYDGCNVTISNCHFYSSKHIYGEGIINIKSHSKGNIPQSGWLDTLGSKYNAIVTGCTFTIDLAETNTSPVIVSGIIRYDSTARSASTVDDDFYLRYGALISNNIFTFRGTSRGASLTIGTTFYPVIECIQGCKNLMVSDNVINADFVSNDKVNYPYVAYILFRLTNDVDTIFYKSRVENCIIQNNIVFGNLSSVVYMFTPAGVTTNLINMKTNDPTNYAKVCPKHNIFRDNIIWSGSDGTNAGRNYSLNPILDSDNILQGNLLHIADSGKSYSSAVNINRATGESYIPAKGDMIFNTNVGKPMWWKGANWVYADGTNV